MEASASWKQSGESNQDSAAQLWLIVIMDTSVRYVSTNSRCKKLAFVAAFSTNRGLSCSFMLHLVACVWIPHGIWLPGRGFFALHGPAITIIARVSQWYQRHWGSGILQTFDPLNTQRMLSRGRNINGSDPSPSFFFSHLFGSLWIITSAVSAACMCFINQAVILRCLLWWCPLQQLGPSLSGCKADLLCLC